MLKALETLCHGICHGDGTIFFKKNLKNPLTIRYE